MKPSCLVFNYHFFILMDLNDLLHLLLILVNMMVVVMQLLYICVQLFFYLVILVGYVLRISGMIVTAHVFKVLDAKVMTTLEFLFKKLVLCIVNLHL